MLEKDTRCVSADELPQHRAHSRAKLAVAGSRRMGGGHPVCPEHQP